MPVVDFFLLGFDTFIPPFELPERFPDRIGHPRNQPDLPTRSIAGSARELAKHLNRLFVVLSAEPSFNPYPLTLNPKPYGLCQARTTPT